MPESVRNNYQDTLKNPGDVQVASVKLYSSDAADPYDLTNIWENISIFEDMSKSYIFGQITISDSQNLTQEIPILNNDRIEIRYKTASAFDFEERVGYIIDIPTRTGTAAGDGTEMLVLDFISPEFVRSKSVKVRKSYRETLISDMVKDIYTQYLQPATGKTFTVAETLTPDSKVVPNMSPIASIGWLTKWAQSPAYRESASFQFFENRTGYFFTPLEGLIDQQTNPTAAEYNVSLSNTQEVRESGAASFVIMDSYEPKLGNHLSHIEKGVFASTIVYRDPILRRTYKDTYNYYDDQSKRIKLNDSAIHNDQRLGVLADSKYVIAPQHSNAFPGNISASRSKDTSLIRQSKLNSFDSMSMKISVPGDSERTIGEVVFLNIPSIGLSTYEENRGERDKYLSGRYLIHSLRHEIVRKESGQPSFRTHMRVVKDSLLERLPANRVLDKTTIPT